MKRLNRIFLRGAGIYNKKFEEDFQTEFAYYCSLGALNVFIALLAGFSAFYFILDISQSAIGATLFGCIWAGLIFHLNRFLLKSIDRFSWRKNSFVFFVRLFLAILTAIIIALPMEILLNERAILEKLKQKKYDTSIGIEITELETANRKRVEELNQLKQNTPSRDDFTLDGRRNVWTLKEVEKLFIESEQRHQSKLEALDNEILIENERIDSLKSSFNKERTVLADFSLIEKIEALEALTPTFSLQWYFQWCIRLILILLEIIPLLAKIQPSFKVYEYSVETWNKKQVALLDAKLAKQRHTKKQKKSDSQKSKELFQSHLNGSLHS